VRTLRRARTIVGVCNAGTIRRARVAEHGDDVLAVNLDPPFLLVREVGARMLRRGRGKIVFAASAASDCVHGQVLAVGGGRLARQGRGLRTCRSGDGARIEARLHRRSHSTTVVSSIASDRPHDEFVRL
jgi:NAD(P)-dependent dehydrogenase (short-subunit alcohol dehydrogenase family)